MRGFRAIRTITLGLLLASAPCLADDEPVFKAGFAERDITPEIGMEQPGGYGKAYHQSIHDPCKVRASVFDDGANRVAIVGIDALGIRRETVEKVRAAIEEETGIPRGSILIGASHSHSSGPCVWIMPGEYDDAPEPVRTLAYEKSTCVDPRYLEMVERALIAAVVEASDRRVPARGGVGSGVEDSVAPDGHASGPGEPRDRRAGRAGRSGGGGDRRLG
jgi:neutral ceramidase